MSISPNSIHALDAAINNDINKLAKRLGCKIDHEGNIQYTNDQVRQLLMKACYGSAIAWQQAEGFIPNTK